MMTSLCSQVNLRVIPIEMQHISMLLLYLTINIQIYFIYNYISLINLYLNCNYQNEFNSKDPNGPIILLPHSYLGCVFHINKLEYSTSQSETIMLCFMLSRSPVLYIKSLSVYSQKCVVLKNGLGFSVSVRLFFYKVSVRLDQL